MTTNEFFEAVNNIQINDLDMYNHVQQITDDFEPQKLQMLSDDFDMFVWRKIELSEIETHSGQSLYVSDIASEKLNSEQINDLERLDDSTDNYSFDEYFDKYSYPTELKFLQRLKILLTNLTQKHIIDRNLSIENENDVVKHPFDEYAIVKIDKPQNKYRDKEQPKSKEPLNQTTKFFELVRAGRISDLDVYSKVQEMTDNFDETKLNLLCDDFDFYLFMEKEGFYSYTAEEIESKMKEYHEADKKIPMLSDRKFSPSQVSEFFEYTGSEMIQVPKEKTPEQKARLEKFMKEWEEDKENILDVEKLFDPYGIEFFCLYKLRNFLVDLKRKHTSAVYKFDDKPKDLLVNNQYINWLESPKSLRQFINALQEQTLIQKGETETIITNHFEPHREQNEEAEPIIWLETTALLAYMIETLDQYYIKPENIWSDTAPHFSVNNKKPENLRQTANHFKKNKTRKPKNHEVIDKIIKSLS